MNLAELGIAIIVVPVIFVGIVLLVQLWRER